jgi:hypothetical protein
MRVQREVIEAIRRGMPQNTSILHTLVNWVEWAIWISLLPFALFRR